MDSLVSPETAAALEAAQRQQQDQHQREQALNAPAPRPGESSDSDGLYIADQEQTPAAIGQRLEGFAHAVGEAQAQVEVFGDAVSGGGFGAGSQDGDALAGLLQKAARDMKAAADKLGEATGVLWKTTLDGFRSLSGQEAENVAGLTSTMEGQGR